MLIPFLSKNYLIEKNKIIKYCLDIPKLLDIRSAEYKNIFSEYSLYFGKY